MTQVQDENPSTRGLARFVPVFRSRWWSVLLGLSLMLNLLVGGLMLGYRFGQGRGFMAPTSISQLVPRSFLADLPSERRQELMKLVRAGTREMGGLRAGSSALALRFADLIEKPDLTNNELNAAIDAFATGADSLAAKSANLAKQALAKLTPEERALLAKRIRERAQLRQRK
jgi:hypothetical protein